MTIAAVPTECEAATPIWHRPAISTLSLGQTLLGTGSGPDGLNAERTGGSAS
jgi:hypothetical protein